MATQESMWWRGEFLARNGEHGADALWGLGAGGVEIRDRDTFFEGDPDYAPVPDGQTRLVAYFEVEDADAGQALAARLERACEEDATMTLVATAPFEDRSWATKWREFFRPRQLSARVSVGPPWEDFDAPAGGHRLVVEPGMAFGTGTHETTQLVSEILDDLLAGQRFERMLDVGCGSGILSMLAAKLGVAHILGVDIDAEALENARHNLGLNDLEGADITYATTPLAEVEGQWPLVVANILAHILLSLRDELIAHVEPGGQLILSGLMEHQLEDLRGAFGGELVELAVHQRGEWFALHYLKPER